MKKTYQMLLSFLYVGLLGVFLMGFTCGGNKDKQAETPAVEEAEEPSDSSENTESVNDADAADTDEESP